MGGCADGACAREGFDLVERETPGEVLDNGNLESYRVLQRAGIRLDLEERRVEYRGRPLAVSEQELAVLEVLMAARGRIVSTEQLLQRAWCDHGVKTARVRLTVGRLRRRLSNPRIIETIGGEGYRIVSDEELARR
jgi:DNA-binding response OmpR family regulator